MKMKITVEEARDIVIMGSSEGICTDCGNGQSGVEPDARGYQCESCGEHSVMGFEEAIFDGHIQVEE